MMSNNNYTPTIQAAAMNNQSLTQPINVPSKCDLMKTIYEIGFSLDDTILFLDTHPNDVSAHEYYKALRDEYKEKKMLYSKYYAPLCATECYNNKHFSWATCPMPWEKEA